MEDYLDAIEEVSTSLLEYIVNMRDGAVSLIFLPPNLRCLIDFKIEW